jgi:hypothetical protein
LFKAFTLQHGTTDNSGRTNGSQTDEVEKGSETVWELGRWMWLWQYEIPAA